MKKIFTFLCALTLVVCVNAAPTKRANFLKANHIAQSTKSMLNKAPGLKGETHNVIANDFYWDEYYYDVYLATEDGFYLFEMKDGYPENGVTYTLDDMEPIYTGWYASEDEGYITTQATTATLKVVQDGPSTTIEASMTLDGDVYNITYQFVPSGKKINVNATNLETYYSSYYDEYCYYASNEEYSDIAIWVYTDVEFGTFTDEVDIAGGYLELPSGDDITFHSVGNPIVVSQDNEGYKHLTGSLFTTSGDEYIFNLTDNEEQPTGINGVKVGSATEVARYTVDGRAISAPQAGINVIKMSDGSVKKVLVK